MTVKEKLSSLMPYKLVDLPGTSVTKVNAMLYGNNKKIKKTKA